MAVARSSGGVRWRQHGRNRARTVSTRHDARDFDAEVRRQRRAGKLAALDAGTETLGEYGTGTWASSHAATLAPKTRLHYASLYAITCVPTSPRSLCVRSPPRSSAAGKQTGWHRRWVPLRFAMRWICLGRSWSAHVWTGDSRRIPLGAQGRRGDRGEMRCTPFRPATIEAMRSALGPRNATLISVLALPGSSPW